MQEKLYPVSPEWARRAHIDGPKYEAMYAASVQDPEGFWCERAAASTGSGPTPRSRTRASAAPALGRGLHPLVRGRRHERRLQLRRPPPRAARRPGRDHLGGRRSRPSRSKITYRELHARGVPHGERPAQPRRRQGRPRHDLPADDPRGRLRDARLRAHRRDPLGRLRRLLAGLAREPHRGLRRRGW